MTLQQEVGFHLNMALVLLNQPRVLARAQLSQCKDQSEDLRRRPEVLVPV